MSTVHEAIVSGYCGMKVLAFSIITDMVASEFDQAEASEHAEICKIAAMRAKDSEKMLQKFLEKINNNPTSLL